MTVAFYMNCVSAHQIPLAEEIAKIVGDENFTYIDCQEKSTSAQSIDKKRITVRIRDKESSKKLLSTVNVLYSGHRDVDLFERRAEEGLKTCYTSERWFKPIQVVSSQCFAVSLPGWVRMFIPSYRRMVKRFVKWANTDVGARVLAIGPWAKRDFLRMGVRADKIVLWGYFVSPSIENRCRCRNVGEPLKVLWAGRDIPLKHVDDIEEAVELANKNLISKVFVHLNDTPITFTKLTGVMPDEVRKAMREHDTFVFASNAYEGWGAVVSESLEEGMNVICSEECGSGPSMLPLARLFKCGDVGALAKLLEAEYLGKLPQCSIGEWTAKSAAQRLCEEL